MKKHNLYGTHHSPTTGFAGKFPKDATEQKGTEHPIDDQLQQSWELVELKQALETSQQQAKVLQEQNVSLVETNASLNRKLMRLAKKCALASHFGYHDKLTGLPNRSLLTDRLKQALVQAARQHKRVALLFIDLDTLKSVNDNFGHAAGDRVLQQVAERLTASIRYSDTVCRYGGDEFVIMLPEMDEQECVATVIEKIRACLAASYEMDGNAIEVAANISCVVYRNDGQDCSELVKQADIAMYLAKAYSYNII